MVAEIRCARVWIASCPKNSTLSNTKQNIIDQTNLLHSENIYIDANNTLDEKLETIDTQISSKMNTINESSKLDSSLIDYSNSSLRFVNINSNLQQKLSSIDRQRQT